MTRKALFVVCICQLVAALANSAFAEQRIALVIGNSAYLHAGVLKNPGNDASDVATALRTLEFKVIEGLDLDKAGMERKIREFAETLQGAAAAVFY
jgi:uncharacterized caspase-like protein